jgi:hypothetical protein
MLHVIANYFGKIGCFKGLRTYFSATYKCPPTFMIVFIDFHKFYEFLHDEIQLFSFTVHGAEREAITLLEVKDNMEMLTENLKIR